MNTRSNRQFYSRLSYSFGNEDPHIERKALNIGPTDKVICITASGDRPLHLLLDEPAEVVAIDLNETQNFLLELKMKAMEQLHFDHYLSFLGGSQDKHRLTKLDSLIPHLSPQGQKFWNGQRRMIAKGVLYQGAVERLCQYLAGTLKFFRKRKSKSFLHSIISMNRNVLSKMSGIVFCGVKALMCFLILQSLA